MFADELLYYSRFHKLRLLQTFAGVLQKKIKHFQGNLHLRNRKHVAYPIIVYDALSGYA